VPYILVEDFRGGLDTRKSVLTAPPGTLQRAINCHINRGGELEKRKAFVLKNALPANSFGLHAVRGNLYVFGSVAQGSLAPALPAGVNYQRLQHPTGAAAMSGLIWAENFDGKIYAIAEYADGNIYHFYDGTRVTSWDSIAASVASNNNVASRLAERIDLQAAYSAAAVGATVTITAAVAGTAFTYSASTTNGGSNPDQAITLTETVANVEEVDEVLATASFRVVGGSAGGGNQVSSITVGGVDVLGAAVAWATSDAATASAVAAQINTYVSSPNYTASANGNLVTISAPVGTGASANGLTVTITVGGSVSVSPSSTTTAGGVTAVSPVAQVVEAAVSGTFEASDTFTITLDGGAYTVSGAASGTGRTAKTLRNKIYSTASSLMYFCANGTPTSWGSGTGSGFINMSNQDGGSEDLTALGIYQSNLAVFSANAVQIWYIDVDPLANRQLQVLPNIGTEAPKSVVSIGDSDVLFLAATGVRSMRARDSSNSASVYDVGTPIDDVLSNDLSDLTEEEQAAALGIIEPRDGRYWLAIGDRIYVFSYFATSKVSAWSIYEPGFSPTDFAVIGKRLYVRGDDDNYYVYGGDAGATYDDCEVDVILPYLSAQAPATMKEVEGIDIACEGRWEVYVGTDPLQPDERVLSHIVTNSTFSIGRLQDIGQTTHVGLRFVNNTAGYARISSVMVHHQAEGSN
jgi:hypothetical protein